MLEENEKDIPTFGDLNFVFSHITTSGNGCELISRHGLMDLRKAYSCEDSEVRRFLESHDVSIDIDERILRYKDKSHDISFERCGRTPSHGTMEYMAWSVGRKIHFDFTVCGFLSIDRRSPYGGNVHLAPEILQDIGNLLKTHLAEDWVQKTRAYEVVARAKGVDIVIDAEGSDRDQMIAYILNAYHEACGYGLENILLLKDGIQIPTGDIID